MSSYQQFPNNYSSYPFISTRVEYTNPDWMAHPYPYFHSFIIIILMLIFPSSDPIHMVTIRPNPNYLCQQRRLQSRRPGFKEYSEYHTDLYITFSWYLYLLYSSQRSTVIPTRDVSAGRGHPVLRGMFRFYRSVTPNLFTNVAIPYCARTFGHSVLSPTSDWSILLRKSK